MDNIFFIGLVATALIIFILYMADCLVVDDCPLFLLLPAIIFVLSALAWGLFGEAKWLQDKIILETANISPVFSEGQGYLAVSPDGDTHLWDKYSDVKLLEDGASVQWVKSEWVGSGHNKIEKEFIIITNKVEEE